MGQTVEEATARTLLDNSNTSILVLMNLMNYKLKASQQDQAAAQLVTYLQRSVVDCFFGSYLQDIIVEDAITGF